MNRWEPYIQVTQAQVPEATETIRWYIGNILTYYPHPMTNAMSEGHNSKIRKIKTRDCGFRNTGHVKTAMNFRCRGARSLLMLNPEALDDTHRSHAGTG